MIQEQAASKKAEERLQEGVTGDGEGGTHFRLHGELDERDVPALHEPRAGVWRYWFNEHDLQPFPTGSIACHRATVKLRCAQSETNGYNKFRKGAPLKAKRIKIGFL